MKKNYSYQIFLFFLFSLFAQGSFAQTSSALNIDSCYSMALHNYPLVKQYELIEKSTEYSVSNASKGYLPQFNVNGQATYQSDVTSVPISFPGISTISKDQYRLYAELSQPITDIFTVKAQKDLLKANGEMETQKLDVELYKLKERINQLYFSILLLDGQIDQTDILLKDIQSAIDKTNAAVNNGVALKSNVEMLEAEYLKAGQKRTELQAGKKGFVEMLSLFINQTLSESIVLTKPEALVVSTTINRPELMLFDKQRESLDFQNKLITTKNLPHLNLFFQGGLGKPALNMLDNEMKGYYITGLRLNWNVSGLYTIGKEKKILSYNQKSLDAQKETFLFNTNLSIKQQNSEMGKLNDLIISDNKIIKLRESIKTTAKNQLEFGTTTTIDYLSFINAEDQAKQNLLLHQIQLLMAQYNYQTITGTNKNL